MSKKEIKIDFRLLNISFEIYAIKDHFKMAENQIKELSKKEKKIAEKILKEENIEFNTPDWQDVVGPAEQKIHVLIPRFFRNPFLVSLYSVYESGVTEIAQKIKEKKNIKLGLKDINGSFLSRSKKYYESILDFELYKKDVNWHRINVLTDIRNAIAHTNGRVDLLKPSLQTRIRKYATTQFDMYFDGDFLVVEKSTSEKLKDAVIDSLSKLVDRYKRWDSNYNSA